MKSSKQRITGFAITFAIAFAFMGCASGGAGDDDPIVDTPVTETPVTETPAKSATCTLSALTISSGTLVPAFDPAVTEYAVDVESSVKSLTVSGTAADAKATVSEEGTAARNLAIGETAIVLTVTAEDGTAKAYTVTAFRKPVVYSVGWFKTGGGSYLPCVWNGATRGALDVPTGTTNADATGVCVDGGSLYVSGYYQTATGYIPCYWKDGVRTDLATGGVAGKASAIAVSGGSIYVAGEFAPPSHGGNYAPCYWKDNVLVELEHSGDKAGAAQAIAVSGGDVYTAGTYSLDNYDRYACYWKGSAKTDLSVPSGMLQSDARAIVISGGSVYVAGSYSTDYTESDSKGAWWKDGARTDVVAAGAKSTWVTSLALSKGEVYLAAHSVDNAGTYYPYEWKGVESISLTAQGSTFTNAIAALGGRPYCAGQTSNGLTGADLKYVACAWEAGVRRDLETDVASDAQAIALGE